MISYSSLQLFRHFVYPTMVVVPSLLAFISIVAVASAKPTLPPQEVQSLRAIASTLSYGPWNSSSNWNFSVDPCSAVGWNYTDPETGTRSAVGCDCNFANKTICHVVSINLRVQFLLNSIPKELSGFPFLQEIDLTGNAITGPIPPELGNFTKLVNLILEDNGLSGAIPSSLGTLPRIEKLILSSNYLTGEIPANLASLSTLKDFRISNNNFTGHIPNFMENWTSIETLMMQASGLSGPIPTGIFRLSNLTDLRISDLSGENESTFPPLILSNATRFEILMLRSCHIVGQLPAYIGNMTGLRVLDLSFNKLSGPIPDSFSSLTYTNYIYLTGNSLSGSIPQWMLQDRLYANGSHIDISYNNNLKSEVLTNNCSKNNLNLFASSKGNNTIGIVSCLRLRSTHCEKEYSSLHINCGGRQAPDNEGNMYEADTDPGGPSNFYLRNTNWGFSSTGSFLEDGDSTNSRIWTSGSSLNAPNSQLYADARVSPLSLTYYSFCLINESYTVKLHFPNASSTLGSQIFDVYIQGNRVLKDFSTALNEDGTIIRNFTTVVDDGTLEIRFYWAGKGTVGIPNYGREYGAAILAISVDSNFNRQSGNGSNISIGMGNGNNISTGAIVGIAVAVLFAIFSFLMIFWWTERFNFLFPRPLRRFLGCNETTLHDLKGLDLNVGLFTLRQIKVATNNFHHANKIGEGGFGCVYKGHLSNGTVVAVKQLSSKSKQGNREFVNEIGMISSVQHPHLVRLYGCSVENNQSSCFEEQQLNLDWPTRYNICIGIARGLAYLHEGSRIKMVHRDIKATNVLLDKKFVPKISDFGLAKLHDEDNTHISTHVAGTIGYMAPEYAMRGYLTDKADVYSFGVVILEIVSGRNNIVMRPDEDCFSLLDWADSLKENGNLLELVDPRLGPDFDKKKVVTSINVGLLCTNAVAKKRPSMSTVISILEGKTDFKDFAPDLKLNPHSESEGLMRIYEEG